MALQVQLSKYLLLYIFFSLVSINSHAALTSFTNDDPLTSSTDTFVYSSVSDVTWLGNGNLLGTLINENNAVITNIVSANSGITYGATNLTVEAADFSNDGRVSWEGAMGFVTYLNSVNYGGSSQWRLPAVVAGISSNLGTNSQSTGDEFAELFYTELGGSGGAQINNLDTDNDFVNLVANNHWTGTEVAGESGKAWNFNTFNGSQQNTFNKNLILYTFVLTPGNLSQVSQVPEPKAYLMLLTGLSLVTLRRSRMRYGTKK